MANRHSSQRPGDRDNSDQRNQRQIQDQVKNLNLNDTEVPKPDQKANQKANDMEIAKAIPEPVDTEIAKANETKKPEPIRARLSSSDVSFHKASEMPKTPNVKPPPKVSFSKPNIDNTAVGPSRAKPVVEDVAKKVPEPIAVQTPVTSPPRAETEMKNIVELLDLEEYGFFETHVLLESNKAAVTIGLVKFQEEYAKITNGLTEECNKMPPVQNFNPRVGDLICGKRLDDWIRGTLISVGHPMRLAAVDEGSVETVTAVRPLPLEFVDFPTLGAVCELTEGDFELQSMEQYNFVVKKINPGSVCQDGAQIVIFSSDDKEGKGFLKPWTPAPDPPGPVFDRMTQDVALWWTKTSSQSMPFSPTEGEMVIAKYAVDNDYYKDVPRDVSMTNEVSKYLAELAEQPKSLLCTIESSPTDDVVLQVIAGGGTCLNDKINEILISNWKKKKDETTVSMIEEMEVAELGQVGQTINVLALHSYWSLMHAMAPQDLELISHVTGVMAAQIEQYCKETKEHYIPRRNELCLALFGGEWFRAVCEETYTSRTTSTVNYIDFGNIEVVEHTNIKLMTKDFTKTKTLASVCSVVGLGPVDKSGDLPELVANRVKELIPPNSPVLVKIVECSKPGEYTVELPEVRDVLVKEGLLKV